MDKIDFVDEFINALQRSVPRRPDLVREVARILRIETEPASRRLSRHVNFSINEMFLLAKEFNISLDSLGNERKDMLWLPFVLDLPWQQASIDSLGDYMDLHYKLLRKICSSPFECVAVYFSLPVEFFMFYPELTKLYFFKWGHFLVDSEEFSDYASWEVPLRFHALKEQLNCLHCDKSKVTYIWDDSLIFSLVREVFHLHSVGVIDKTSKEQIRLELHTLLYDMEKFLRNPDEDPLHRFGDEFYITSIQIGANAVFMKSEKAQAASFSTHFTNTKVFEDADYCTPIREWILSLKGVSTLISGSGYKERSLFFKDQHEIVDFQLR